jgi:hypothetical protein
MIARLKVGLADFFFRGRRNAMEKNESFHGLGFGLLTPHRAAKAGLSIALYSRNTFASGFHYGLILVAFPSQLDENFVERLAGGFSAAEPTLGKTRKCDTRNKGTPWPKS